MLKRYGNPASAFFLAIWLLLMIGGQSRFFRDPGTFWHTVVGRHILATGQFSTTDSFSFTFTGQPWYPQQWFGECLMAFLHDRLDGLDTLLLAATALLAWLFTLMACRFLRAGLHWLLAAVLVSLALGAAASHFHIRPHLATILLLGLSYALLCDFEAGRTGLGRLFWLVPIFLVWTNTHGGMLGGLATLTLVAAGWILCRGLGLPTPITCSRQALVLAGLVLACGLTVLMNPFGRHLPEIWLGILGSPLLPHIIQEHAPLDPRQVWGWLVLLFGGVYLAALLATLPCWPRMTWLLPLPWFGLACMHIRHAPLFAVTAGLALADILPHTLWAAGLARRGSDLFRPLAAPPHPTSAWQYGRALWLPGVVILLALFLKTAQVRVPVLGHGWARLDPTYWPVEIEPELQRLQAAHAEGTPIFNELLDGGFLIYHTPGFRVFIDDRCELYGDGWLWDYTQAECGQKTTERLGEWQRRWPRFDFALTRTGSAFDHSFADAGPEWQLLARTTTATLYQRSGSLISHR